MAVQFADKALDELLSKNIESLSRVRYPNKMELGYLQALRDIQQNLHSLWGSALEEPSGEES